MVNRGCVDLSGRKIKRTVFLLAVLLGVILARAFSLSDYFSSAETATKEDVYVLAIGVDQLRDHAMRSDTIMFMRFNRIYKKLVLISIPRDTVVPYNKKVVKINSLFARGFAKGGLKKGIKTLEDALKFIGFPGVDYWVVVDFEGFEKFIDWLGGVEVEVKKPMFYKDVKANLVIAFKPGRYKLNGRQLLAYLRYRDKVTADIGRIKRQQQFVKQLINTLFSPSNFLKLPLVIQKVYEFVKTNASLGVIMQLANEAMGLDLVSFVIKGKGGLYKNMAVYVPDVDSLAELLFLCGGSLNKYYVNFLDKVVENTTWYGEKAREKARYEEKSFKNKITRRKKEKVEDVVSGKADIIPASTQEVEKLKK